MVSAKSVTKFPNVSFLKGMLPQENSILPISEIFGDKEDQHALTTWYARSRLLMSQHFFSEITVQIRVLKRLLQWTLRELHHLCQ